MTPLATVLYEDKMLPGPSGSYPLHDLVMRLVEDEVNGQTYKLKRLIEKNPRNGIGNVLNDLRSTSLLAGAGTLFLLIDRDVLAAHLKLPTRARDEEIEAALKNRSDAPDKLRSFFLQPNLEGLLRSVRDCDPMLLPDNVARALTKKLNDRDLVLNELKKAHLRALRDCVRKAQPGLDALAGAIAAIVSPDAVA